MNFSRKVRLADLEKFGDAIQTFKTGINRVVSEQAKDQLNSQTEVGKLYVILNINAAFAALNQKTKDAYQLAEQFCNVALEIDSNNQKGLYRRALANKELA